MLNIVMALWKCYYSMTFITFCFITSCAVIKHGSMKINTQLFYPRFHGKIEMISWLK